MRLGDGGGGGLQKDNPQHKRAFRALGVKGVFGFEPPVLPSSLLVRQDRYMKLEEGFGYWL